MNEMLINKKKNFDETFDFFLVASITEAVLKLATDLLVPKKTAISRDSVPGSF